MVDRSPEQGPGWWSGLRGKGLLFLLALLLYALVLTGYILFEKQRLEIQLGELDRLQERESVLVEADLAAFSAITDLFVIGSDSSREEVLERVHRHFTNLQQRYSRLLEFYPERAVPFREMLRLLAQIVTLPNGEILADMRAALAENKRQVSELLARNREQRQQAMEAYLARSDQVARVAIVYGGVGLLLFALVVATFFTRLTRDLLRLQKRVGEIEQGWRDQPLASHRDDELGELIAGVNRMAADLAERERELEIERQKRFHLDKMGTLGHVAAGFVHELGNPIAAIIGLAEEAQRLHAEGEPARDELGEVLAMISAYGERMLKVSEDLAALNRPRADQFSLFHPGELLAAVEKVMRYDERWYGIRFLFEVDEGLPAVFGSIEQLQQLLINLITNACEAILDAGGDGKVRVQARAEGGQLRLEVCDTGPGMDSSIREQVFDEPVSTREGRLGLGLMISRAIATAHGGRLELGDSERGCRMVLSLPFAEGGDSDA